MRSENPSGLYSLFCFYTKINWNPQYLNWENYGKKLSKQYAIIREPYVKFQTFKGIEKKLKALDKKYCIELGNYQESNYRFIVKENSRLAEIVRPLNESVITFLTAIKNGAINSDQRSLNKWHHKTFQKSNYLFKGLTLASSPGEYHQFRKWGRYYFQQSILGNLALQKTRLKEISNLHKIIELLGYEYGL
jgi:hypothetical protein